MAALNERPLSVSQALAGLDVLASSAAREIIGRGQIRVFAIRGDMPASTTPEPVEELLAKATRTDVSGDEITVLYDAGQDVQSILGRRSNVRNTHVVAWLYRKAACTVNLHSASIYWSELAEALAPAGFTGYVAPHVRWQQEGLGTRRRNCGIPQSSRRGPEPGKTGLLAADRPLFTVMRQMLEKGEAPSRIAAARVLVAAGRVAGKGTDENRANRLARNFGKYGAGPEV